MAPLPLEWQVEFDRLRTERDLAWRDRAAMSELVQLCARQNEQLDQIAAMLRRYEARIKRLESENRKLRKELGRDPDPDPDPPPPPPAGEPETSGPITTGGGDGSAGGGAGASPTKGRRTGKGSRPRASGGRRLPPEHLPADTETHAVTACGCCGGRVLKRDVLVTEVYSVVPTYVRRRIIRRERVICADPVCNAATTAPMPPMPWERALYDARFLAWLVVMKFLLLVPLDRIRTLLLLQGVDLAMGTLVHLIERASHLVAPIDAVHMRLLKKGAWMSFDGTGLKTLILGQSKAWDGYLEVYTRDVLTVFQYDVTKHADRLRRRLGDFEGMLLCDAETRNEAGAPRASFANCNAHPRRALRDAEKSQPNLAAQGGRFIQALYELEDQAEAADLTGPNLVAFRRRRSLRVLHRFRQWLDAVVARPLPPSDPVRKVAKYYVKHFEALTRFVDHADLPIDNNGAEREFQRHAKLRHASLFAGSPEGAHRWAILLGVVRTAQKCDVDVLAWLTWVFEHRGTHRPRLGRTAAELTPMAYKAWLDEQAKQAA